MADTVYETSDYNGTPTRYRVIHRDYEASSPNPTERN